jgi:hypothetical protein
MQPRTVLPGTCFSQEILEVTGTIKLWNCLTDIERGIEHDSWIVSYVTEELKGEIYKRTAAVFWCNYVIQMIYHEQLTPNVRAVCECTLQELDSMASMQW